MRQGKLDLCNLGVTAKKRLERELRELLLQFTEAKPNDSVGEAIAFAPRKHGCKCCIRGLWKSVHVLRSIAASQEQLGDVLGDL